MNNSRRKRINESLLALREAQAKLKIVISEEQSALSKLSDDDEYDEMRDGMDGIISGLEDTISSLGDTIDTLDSAEF